MTTYKLGIFVALKKGEKLVRWLPERFDDFDTADAACVAKNKELGVSPAKVKPGDRFAMFDDA